jgi:hypothetical protein
MSNRLLQFRRERAIHRQPIRKARASTLSSDGCGKQRDDRSDSACCSYSSFPIHEWFTRGAIYARAADAQYRQASRFLKACPLPEFLSRYFHD